MSHPLLHIELTRTEAELVLAQYTTLAEPVEPAIDEFDDPDFVTLAVTLTPAIIAFLSIVVTKNRMRTDRYIKLVIPGHKGKTTLVIREAQSSSEASAEVVKALTSFLTR